MIVFLLLSVLAYSSKQSCQEALINGVSTLLNMDQSSSPDQSGLQSLYYSGKDINDLGHYSSCVSQPNSRYILLTYAVVLKVGLCVPLECDSETIDGFLKEQKIYGVIVDESFDYELPPGTVIVLIFLVLLVLIELIATAIDLCSESPSEEIELNKQSLAQTRQEGAQGSIIKCFSLANSWKCLTAPPVQDNSVVLNGPRFMSICWVVLGHTFLIWMFGVNNLEDIPYLMQKFTSILAITGFNAVDTFFWMGGFLVGYLTLLELYKRKKLPWGLVIVLRYLRIVPAYAVAVATSYCVILQFVSGPRLHDIKIVREADCEDYWWTNFLFVNNFVPDWKGNSCFAHAWYLAVDMQMFLFSLILIYMYFKLPKVIVWVVSVVYLVVEFIIRYEMAEEQGFQIFNAAFLADPEYFTQFMYTKPYCRYSTYLLGLLCGFVYYQFKNNRRDDPVANCIIKYGKKLNWLFLIVGLALFQGMTTIQYICAKDIENGNKGFSDSANVFMVGIKHIYVGLSYSLIFMPMMFGRMGILSDFLGWWLWSPLAKLAYSIYLIHFGIMISMYGNDDNKVYWTSTYALSQTLFFIVISVLGGFLLYMLVECPSSELIRHQFKGKKKAKVQSK